MRLVRRASQLLSLALAATVVASTHPALAEEPPKSEEPADWSGSWEAGASSGTEPGPLPESESGPGSGSESGPGSGSESGSASASADPSAAPRKKKLRRKRKSSKLAATKPAVVEKLPESGFALGFNLPFLWSDGNVAVQMAFGFQRHHAIRINLASYKEIGHPESETTFRGSVTDFSAGWGYYPRSLWSGLSLELGALVRVRDHSENHPFGEPETLDTDSTTVAGRVLAGWTWRLGSRVFFAAAAGASLGYERGTLKGYDDYGDMLDTTRINRKTTDFEGYLRFGVALDD